MQLNLNKYLSQTSTIFFKEFIYNIIFVPKLRNDIDELLVISLHYSSKVSQVIRLHSSNVILSN